MLRPWKVTLGERIDNARDEPIYLQITKALIRDIEGGRLTSGTFLPSSRELATALGVNRKTVVLAYEDLISQGWLESCGTRGTMVSTLLPGAARTHNTPVSGDLAITANYRFAPPPARPLALPGGTGIKLDEGTPDGRLLPPELLSRAFRSAIQSASRENRLQYRDPRGSDRLREAIASMLKSERGLRVTARNVCITRGSQNGIFLAAQLLLRPNNAVAVEELTYEPAVAAFNACAAEVVPVRLDQDGIDVTHLETVCRRHQIRAVFLTPHHQFPTTVSLRPERRLRVLDLARQFGFAIIEDDYDHEFHFESQPLLPMAAYAPEQMIYVGSLSKLLLPSLRIGYIAAPEDVINGIAHRVSLTDGMGNTLVEDAAAEMIESGELRRHARKVRQVYGTRRERFAELLHSEIGDIADFAMPDGGLAFWLRFRRVEDLRRIEERAPGMGLRFASSRSFATSDDVESGLRLGFASLTPYEARQALRTLREAAR
ncbi:MAG: transcriptional regulator with domain and aminotransferase domain [Rhizorhabdus sp.]|nr:transcriptional regulator with domain and aminotransferase domain [Rhizorhabdus sp.]